MRENAMLSLTAKSTGPAVVAVLLAVVSIGLTYGIFFKRKEEETWMNASGAACVAGLAIAMLSLVYATPFFVSLALKKQDATSVSEDLPQNYNNGASKTVKRVTIDAPSDRPTDSDSSY